MRAPDNTPAEAVERLRRKLGRPYREGTQGTAARVTVRLAAAELEALDTYREAHQLTRAEAFRKLLAAVTPAVTPGHSPPG